jgi:hypothetical protein
MHMTHIEHKPFQWIHATGSFINRCDIDIFLHDKQALIVATEREEDAASGMSVSSGAAIIATILMQKYRLEPENIHWIEHFPEKLLDSRDVYRMGEVYHRVVFEFQGNRLLAPRWKPLDAEGTRVFIDALKNSWEISGLL